MQTSGITQRLTPDQAEALWRRWNERHDARARDELVLAYSPMVRYLASRRVRDLPIQCELDDLVSEGLIALIEAVDRFDPRKGASFEQYAWTRVSGALVDMLRRQDWASRSVRRAGRKIERARDDWYAREGRPPSEQELAQALQLSVEELRASLEDIERADVMSLNSHTRSSVDQLPVEVVDTVGAPTGDHEPETSLVSSERVERVRAAIAELSERERHVLALIHVHELQGAEVGRMLGVSESRVSQILAGVRAKLRAELRRYDSDIVAA